MHAEGSIQKLELLVCGRIKRIVDRQGGDIGWHQVILSGCNKGIEG